MSEEIKYMKLDENDIDMSPNDFKEMNYIEFVKNGYLQEANRRFFHPLGLALAVVTNEDDTNGYYTVVDRRECPEGCTFDFESSELFPEDKLKEVQRKYKVFQEDYRIRSNYRLKKLGFVREPMIEGN